MSQRPSLFPDEVVHEDNQLSSTETFKDQLKQIVDSESSDEFEKIQNNAADMMEDLGSGGQRGTGTVMQKYVRGTVMQK